VRSRAAASSFVIGKLIERSTHEEGKQSSLSSRNLRFSQYYPRTRNLAAGEGNKPRMDVTRFVGTLIVLGMLDAPRLPGPLRYGVGWISRLPRSSRLSRRSGRGECRVDLDRSFSAIEAKLTDGSGLVGTVVLGQGMKPPPKELKGFPGAEVPSLVANHCSRFSAEPIK
jgi:hypothetical protein